MTGDMHMAALEHELIELFQKLTLDQQLKVLEFIRNLDNTNFESDWENQPWMEEEIRELLTPKPQTGAEIAAWLIATSPPNEG
jgi:hypothetical protein